MRITTTKDIWFCRIVVLWSSMSSFIVLYTELCTSEQLFYVCTLTYSHVCCILKPVLGPSLVISMLSLLSTPSWQCIYTNLLQHAGTVFCDCFCWMVINWLAVVLTRCVCVGRLLLSVVLLGLIVIVLSVGVVGLRTFFERTNKWCVMILFFLNSSFSSVWKWSRPNRTVIFYAACHTVF